MKWRSVSSSANSMLIDLPLDMSTVAFTSFQASLPFVPRSKIPERETLLSELSWIGPLSLTLNAIDDYIRWPKQCGERITDESPLFRKGFDKRDSIAVSSPVSITRETINFIVAELLDKSGVRPRQRMTEEELKRGIRTKRTNLQMNHGLRKFTISNMIRARLEPNARRLLVGQELSGMDSHYDRREQEELLAEYTKAIDYLVIDDSNKIRVELQTLRVEKNSWEELRKEVDNLKALLNKG